MAIERGLLLERSLKDDRREVVPAIDSDYASRAPSCSNCVRYLRSRTLSDKRVVALIDSDAALGAIVKGYSRKDDISDLVSILWETIARHNIIVYFDRVSTDANIGDGPSRDHWDVKTECDWETLHAEWAMGVC